MSTQSICLFPSGSPTTFFVKCNYVNIIKNGCSFSSSTRYTMQDYKPFLFNFIHNPHTPYYLKFPSHNFIFKVYVEFAALHIVSESSIPPVPTKTTYLMKRHFLILFTYNYSLYFRKN